MPEEGKLAETYFAFHRAVYEPGTLDKKTKELIALAVATAIKCEHCVDTHSQKARVAGASPQEIREAVYVAAALSAGATLAYGKKAWELRSGEP